MVKKIILLSLTFLFFSPLNLLAGGVVLKDSPGVFTSVLHKSFLESTFRGQRVERWILIRTNLPRFDVNYDFREFHRKLTKTFVKNGWKYYLLPRDPYFVYEGAINLGNNIYVYKRQPKTYKHKAVPIVDYDFNAVADIEIVFLESSSLSFEAVIPEVDPSSLFNSFKYRGEKLPKFFSEVIVGKYEKALRQNHNYE